MAGNLAMGGYAQWVWSAYGLAAIVLVVNVIAASRRYRHAIERLRRRMDRPSGSGGR